MTTDRKRAFYEARWSREDSALMPDFEGRFEFLVRGLMQGRSARTILDLGGGTGADSMALQSMGYDVTLFDFSQVAVDKAAAAGVKHTLCGDFWTHDFGADRFDVVMAKGFSPLNTDDPITFERGLERARSLLNPGGVVLFWAYSTLEERWSSSGWYELGFRRLSSHFDAVLILPWFGVQSRLPWWLNVLVTPILGQMRFGRRVAVIGGRRQ